MRRNVSREFARTRTLRWLVAGVLTATIANTPTPSQASTVTIAIGSRTAARSSQVQLPITLTGGAAGLAVDVLFPANVLAVAPAGCAVNPGKPGEVLSAQVTAPNTPAGMGRLRVRHYGTTATTGQVVTCTFTVAGNAPTGTHALPGSMGQASDAQGHALATAVLAGAITVTP